MFGVLMLAQGEAPSAGAAPKVSPVGVPGAAPATTTESGATGTTGAGFDGSTIPLRGGAAGGAVAERLSVRDVGRVLAGE